MQAERLLTARKQGQQSVEVSPDLGISMVTAKLSNDGVEFPRGEQVSWQDIEKIKKATVNCFVVENGGIRAIQVFSEDTNRMCSLLPTKRTPSMLIAGFTMHRIVDIDPMQDTLKKIATIAPISGRVLDTATGLGYTAIEAAKTAEQVITIELDPGAQEIAQLNPWSRGLFNNPKIQQIMGDAFEVVPTFEDIVLIGLFMIRLFSVSRENSIQVFFISNYTGCLSVGGACFITSETWRASRVRRLQEER